MRRSRINQQLSDTVRSFGVLDHSVAREDRGWTGESFGLRKAVKDFCEELSGSHQGHRTLLKRIRTLVSDDLVTQFRL